MHNERGNYLVELALALPLFLLLLFGVIDLSRIAGGYASVHSATTLGARRGAALDRNEWQRIRTIFQGFPPTDDQFIEAGPFLGRVQGLGDHTEFASETARTAWYDCMFDGAPSEACTFNQRQVLDGLYRMEVRAIGYAHEALRRAVGNMPYPCDARLPTGQPGCFRCFTLRGDIDTYEGLFQVNGATWISKQLALRCEFDVPITAPIAAFGWFPPFVTVSSERFINIDFYDDFFYSPAP